MLKLSALKIHIFQITTASPGGGGGGGGQLVNTPEKNSLHIARLIARYAQSLDSDMQRLFIQRGHRRSLLMLRKMYFLIWEENDGGHWIKWALYIGIKRNTPVIDAHTGPGERRSAVKTL